VELENQFSDPKSDTYKKDERRRATALDERDYYKAVNVFWVPQDSRWSRIQENSKQPDIAQRIDNALYEVEKRIQSWKALLKDAMQMQSFLLQTSAQ
jgi:type I restriction enzyme M protein